MVKVIHGKHGLLDNPNCYKGHDLVWVNVIKVVVSLQGHGVEFFYFIAKTGSWMVL